MSDSSQKSSESKRKLDLFSLYISVRKFIQPYWNPKPKNSKQKKAKSISTHGDELLLDMVDMKREIHKIRELSKLPKLNECWSFHNKEHHTLLAHLEPGSGFRSKERSNKDRKKTKLCIRPTNFKAGEIHRTHMLPIGYHGSENDERLVVGWSGNSNTGIFNEFEQKMKQINNHQPVYWLTDIRLLPNNQGAQWTYIVLNENLKPLGTLQDTIKSEFIWDDYRRYTKKS